MFLTARAEGHTLALARLFGLECSVVGSVRGRHVAEKIFRTGVRAGALLRLARQHQPDLAVSHGSRSLVLAAAAMGVPSVTLYDYEQVSARIFHRLSRKVMIPECVPVGSLLARGLKCDHLVQYPGIKEQVYLADFRAAHSTRARLGIAADEIMAVIRPESETAHYRRRNPMPLLDVILRHVASHSSTHIVLVPRNAAQGESLSATLKSLGARFQIPEASDGRELIAEADLVIGGGGTMTREAAALGVPAYSFFQGAPGAVDAYLARNGRLVLVSSVDDVNKIRVERTSQKRQLSDAGTDVLGTIVDEICSTAV